MILRVSGMEIQYINIRYHYLVGGFKHEFYFPIIYGIILPIDFHIFQRGRSTTNQNIRYHYFILILDHINPA